MNFYKCTIMSGFRKSGLIYAEYIVKFTLNILIYYEF